jgi:YHS domain-containing protein
MKALIASILAGLFFAGAANAGDPANKKCPVSGKDIDATKTSEVSVTVGFCCSKCQAKFEGDAEAKAKAVKKYAGSKDSPANTKCEISGKDLNKDNTATASLTVAFCCGNCKEKFDAEPRKYMDKVK